MRYIIMLFTNRPKIRLSIHMLNHRPLCCPADATFYGQKNWLDLKLKIAKLITAVQDQLYQSRLSMVLHTQRMPKRLREIQGIQESREDLSDAKIERKVQWEAECNLKYTCYENISPASRLQSGFNWFRFSCYTCCRESPNSKTKHSFIYFFRGMWI